MEDIPTPLPPTTPKPPADRMSVGVDAAPRNVGRGQDEKPIQAPGLREAARDAVKEETPSPMAVAGETRPAVAGGTVARRPSLLGSAQRIERELAASGDSGQGKLVHATGQQIGGFFFDPQGADFTAWLNHLRNELYRNWIVPQAALLGYHGEVDIEFTVSRDGTLHDLHVLSSTGTPSLDRAAANALLGSRPLPLPADYAPAELTFRIGFIYNDARGRS
jgi:protein TonB